MTPPRDEPRRSPAPCAGVDAICDAFEADWFASHEPRIEDFLLRGASGQRDELLRELLVSEWDLCRRHGRPPEFEAYCARFPEKRHAVADLWRVWSEKQAQSVPHGPAIEPGTTRNAALVEQPGTLIDRYKLLEKLGEGGFGTVWAAEQREPVKRRVALKVIKLGMDTRQVIARFEAERQALALMDHPNVAKVLDAGSTQAGRPYFVMELVKGVPISTYCDENHLTSRQRLELFMAVCHAVQHAHHKGIIHRDLKPSNVLVAEYDHQAVPKVIDFGVAKALNQTLTENTIYTHFGQLIGTLDYMSPEQAKLNQLDIDTRSDVYSLGVLLYELLTGTTPFDKKRLHSSGLEEAMRIIREEEPPKPSTRVDTSDNLPALAAKRKIEPRNFAKLLRGDLDWIVIKALAKERSDRYQTAAAFAADVRRYLEDQPIEARRPSTLARVQRFVRRNKLPVALGSSAVVALAIAISFAFLAHSARLSRWEEALTAREAREERNRVLEAQQRERRVREVDIPRIRQLMELEHFVPAFQLAQAAKTVLPDDPELAEIRKQLVATTTITTEPSGARVWIRDWHASDTDQEWLELGRTPLVEVEVPQSPREEDPLEKYQGVFRWRLEKEGYDTRELNAYVGQIARLSPIQMPAEASVPEGMVYMPDEKGLLFIPKDHKALGDFWIDRFEVTNRQFKQFVATGGYERREYWEHEFVKDGETIPWEEAVALLRDETGRPAPATWADGRYPQGEGDYPVRGVSWYEAAAYARFVGKSLPTIHHWASAANVDLARCIVPLSNFSGRGPAPVGFSRGIGRFDVYDMAGNVAEWCWNESEDHRRCLRGGAWDDPDYVFTTWTIVARAGVDALPPLDRPPNVGFRCVQYLDQPTVETLAPAPTQIRDFAAETRATAEELEQYLTHYKYFRDLPLNARRSSSAEQFEEYIHETVRIDAAYGGEQFDIHLFLPHSGRPPYEPIVIVPIVSAFHMERFVVPPTDPTNRYTMRLLDERRALCWPVCYGMYGRRIPPGEWSRERERDLVIHVAKDLLRTVDYLQTRSDMDLDKLAFYGASWGAKYAPTLMVVEPRFKIAILLAGGYGKKELPEIDPFQFAPFVKIPVLMVNGRYDPIFPLESSQEPLFEDLKRANRDTRHVVLNSRHAPPIDESLKLMDEWLRERFRNTVQEPIR